MVATRVEIFGGMVPARDDRLLPPLAAAHSVNCWLYSGKLVPLRQPKLVHELDDPLAAKVYRIPASYSKPRRYDNSIWMEFPDHHTDVIRSPVIEDEYDRYYWATVSQEPMYNTFDRIENGDPEWILGVPQPSGAPTINVTGGTVPTETRAYVITYVTEYGEEGPPSSPVSATGNANGSWDLTAIPVPVADDVGGPDRNITDKRIYRTVTSVSGVATYFFVAEIGQATTTYSDTFTDDQVTANEELPSSNWFAPPDNLEGWVMMPNGILAGWRHHKNEIWFSEPYRPHAWPRAYVLTVEFPVVGMGVVGQSLIVCTTGYPVAVTGSHPESMSQANLTLFEPCTGRSSIISAPEGVYYASPNGLVLINPGRAANITQNLVTKDRWQTLTNTTDFRAGRLGQAYVGYGTAEETGPFEVETFDPDAFVMEDVTGLYNGVLIDVMNENIAYNQLYSGDQVMGIQQDAFSDALLLVMNEAVYVLDQSQTEQDYEIATWRSKKFEVQDLKNFGAFKVHFELDNKAPTLNPTRNTELVQSLANDQYALFRMYADDRLVCTRELRRNGEIMRLPSGFKAETWQFELETRVKINKVEFATSSRELAAV